MGNGQGERKEDELSIAEQEARQTYPAEYQYGLREAYLRGRNAPPADAEIEVVARRLCWDSCEWDGVDSYAAKDEDDAWNYAGGIPGFHEGYIRQAKELLALARKAVNE